MLLPMQKLLKSLITELFREEGLIFGRFPTTLSKLTSNLIGDYMRRYVLPLVAILSALTGPALSEPKHGISLYGELKYGPDFKQFDYVNPDAPRGGEVRLATSVAFDTFNPFVIKGNPATGVGFLYSPLVEFSRDEVFAGYGYLAETIEMPEDRSWVEYKLRPEAKWHDGQQITVEDVIFSLEILRTKGRPIYRHYYKNISKVEKTGERKVRFHFSGPKNLELPVIAGQLTILPKHYWEGRDFNATTLDPPVGSGPYKIKSFKAGRGITYERIKNHWADNIPVQRGRYNFGEISFVYLRDMTVSFEAFKSHETDFRREADTKVWMRGYDFPARTNGLVIKEETPDANPQPMQAFIFNIRRSIFQDRKVREALNYAYDFDWVNKNILHGQFTRTDSYFENTELASSGIPMGEELALLEPYRDKLPNEVFEKEFDLPTTSGEGGIRQNLRTARKLLENAGWRIKDGKLVSANTGEHFNFEIMFRQANIEERVAPFVANLKRLGIEARMRLIDTSQWIHRLRNNDFDMTVQIIQQTDSPGNEQREYWSSAAADQPGSNNRIGIKDPVVDALIEHVISAENRKALITATHALDRVLLWGHYVIPNYHLAINRIAYWNRFAKPKIKSKYAIGFVDTWWIDAEKDAALQAARKKR